MTGNNDNIKQIDFNKIIKQIKPYKKEYIVTLPIVFVLSCLLIICVPRYYTSTVKLAPELASLNSNSLSDLASSFGFDIGGSAKNGDAIFPELYPDVISSNDFIVNLFNIKVVTKEGNLKTTYFDYLSKYQKSAWWNKALYGIKSLFSKKETSVNKSQKVNPFMLTKKEDMVAKAISGKIKCSVDKKNYVISITVEDQDPLIAATIADTVRVHLQNFITAYRTKKAINDYNHIKQLVEDVKNKYEQKRRQYGAYSDANQDVVLESFRLKQNDLENEMQLYYNNYTALQNKLEVARAKVMEQTPAFTTLQNASVPLKPAGPKRMLFVLGMTFLAFVVITLYALRSMIFTEE